MSTLRRLCDRCDTPLWGRRGHGFVVGRLVLCGRKADKHKREDCTK